MKRKAEKGVPDPVRTSLQQTTGQDVPYRRLKISNILPNDYNPNKMTQEIREKLTRGVKLLMESVGHIPPIIVRRHPEQALARWQIIDGQHRWEVLRDEGFKKIDAYIVDVDTKTAMILTDTLNYLRGDPDPDLYVRYYEKLLTEHQMTAAEVAEYVPETEGEIIEMLENYNIEIEHVAGADAERPSNEADEYDPFVEVKFLLSRSQVEVVEAELARIGALLQGKNIRGRALEFMSVNSSHTSINNLTGENVEKPRKKKRKKAA